MKHIKDITAITTILLAIVALGISDNYINQATHANATTTRYHTLYKRIKEPPKGTKYQEQTKCINPAGTKQIINSYQYTSKPYMYVKYEYGTKRNESNVKYHVTKAKYYIPRHNNITIK